VRDDVGVGVNRLVGCFCGGIYVWEIGEGDGRGKWNRKLKEGDVRDEDHQQVHQRDDKRTDEALTRASVYQRLSLRREEERDEEMSSK